MGKLFQGHMGEWGGWYRATNVQTETTTICDWQHNCESVKGQKNKNGWRMALQCNLICHKTSSKEILKFLLYKTP